MRIRFMTMLVMVASLLVASGQALAQPQLPTFQSGDVLRADQLNRIVEQVRKNTSASGGSGGAMLSVNCNNAGETIQSKIDEAQPGDTIMITGTCNEAVEVSKGGVTLDGDGSAVIDAMDFDAAGISVNGHQNVTIKGLTVQNGLGGIRIVESAAVWLENVTVQGSRQKPGYEGGTGIAVATSSTLVLTGNVVIKNNAWAGFWVGQSSSAVVLGNFVIRGYKLPPATLQVNDNGAHGVEVLVSSAFIAYSASDEYATIHAKDNTYAGISVSNGSSFVLWSGTNVEVTGNGGNGLEAGGSGSVAFYGSGAGSRGVTGVFNNNGGNGILLWNSSSLAVWDDGAAVNITATNNAGSGLAIANGSSANFDSPASPPPSKLIFNDNGGDGISADNNAMIHSKVPVEAKNNDYEGVDAWGGSSITLHAPTVTDNDGHGIEINGNSSAYIEGATVTGNTTLGVGVVNTSTAILSGCDITNNGGDGLHTGNNSTVQFYDLTIMGNSGHGIGAYNHSFVQSYEDAGSSITGNAMHGIQAWNDASLQLWNPTIMGNTNDDVNASFGSRFAFYGGTVGDIYCDDSVLSQGDWVCPDDDESDQ